MLLVVSCCLLDPLAPLVFFLCFEKSNGKTNSAAEARHNPGSYTPYMKGCSHKERDVQCIYNIASNSDYKLEKITRKQSNLFGLVPSWAHSLG